jgi:hypothetical protein
MEEVNRQGEIGNQLGSGHEEKQEDHAEDFEMMRRLVYLRRVSSVGASLWEALGKLT